MAHHGRGRRRAHQRSRRRQRSSPRPATSAMRGSAQGHAAQLAGAHSSGRARPAQVDCGTRAPAAVSGAIRISQSRPFAAGARVAARTAGVGRDGGAAAPGGGARAQRRGTRGAAASGRRRPCDRGGFHAERCHARARAATGMVPRSRRVRRAHPRHRGAQCARGARGGFAAGHLRAHLRARRARHGPRPACRGARARSQTRGARTRLGRARRSPHRGHGCRAAASRSCCRRRSASRGR